MANKPQLFWRSPPGYLALGLIAIAAYFVVMEHRAHVVEVLPYGLLLLCPLMHIFMHRGHGAHQDKGETRHVEASEATHHDPHHTGHR